MRAQASTAVFLQSATAFFVIVNCSFRIYGCLSAAEAGVIITFPVCIHKVLYFLFMIDSVYINTVIQSQCLVCLQE